MRRAAALTTLLLLVAAAPSKTMDRAKRLAAKNDWLSASIELTKVVSGETSDDEATVLEARFLLLRASLRLGFPSATQAGLVAIAGDPNKDRRGTGEALELIAAVGR